MRQLRSTGFGLVVLFGLTSWAVPAGAQSPSPEGFVPAPVPHAAAPPAAVPAGKPTLAPGGVTVRINGRINAIAGVASDSSRGH